jgi:hypothetical protein
MHNTSTTAVKHKPSAKISEALVFVDAGHHQAPAPDLAQRVRAFYERHPLRAVKRGQRGIVESLKADRDRR